uniref:Monocyte to macrophage differentiation associated 2 n=1 Tax=Taeniopygia guttata TaxID=59729 RepID=H0ZBK5_TAEGU
MLVSRLLDFQKTRYARFMNHRVPSNCRYQPTEYEHAANCATHAFWILPSILGSSILYILSDDQWETISAWIYGFGLSSLFIVSTIFHTISWKKRHLRTVEHCLHMFDRMVIYFFIAASYAPWLNLRELGPWASHMRWIIWIMASIGTVYVFFFHERYKLVELVCYVIMGFFPALVILSMPNRDGLLELVAGGFFYCLGMVFFKSDGRIPFAHAIWHLFVAIGAGIHYYAIWRQRFQSTVTDWAVGDRSDHSLGASLTHLALSIPRDWAPWSHAPLAMTPWVWLLESLECATEGTGGVRMRGEGCGDTPAPPGLAPKSSQILSA